MEWVIKEYDSLGLNELYSILKLRAEIFVVEQNCVYNDLDDLDIEASHLICTEKDSVIGYARLLRPNTRFKNSSIGRVVIQADQRKRNIGKELMNKSIQYILEEWNETKINISAQKYLEKFYSDLGFVTISETYLEDGIPHIKMEWEVRK